MTDDEAAEDLERIAGAVDGNGDEVPQDHPIENPGENGEEADDPIAEPHPDEPGTPDEEQLAPDPESS
jgi:hypothetical protein